MCYCLLDNQVLFSVGMLRTGLTRILSPGACKIMSKQRNNPPIELDRYAMLGMMKGPCPVIINFRSLFMYVPPDVKSGPGNKISRRRHRGVSKVGPGIKFPDSEATMAWRLIGPLPMHAAQRLMPVARGILGTRLGRRLIAKQTPI